MKVLFLAVMLWISTGVAKAQSDTLPVYFDLDRWTLRKETRQLLDQFTDRYLQGSDTGGLQILGFCDSLGSHSYNDRLSERRTRAVKEYLLNKKIPLSSINRVKGFGERAPVNDNATPEERQANRRVDLVWLRQAETSTTLSRTKRDTSRTFDATSLETVTIGETLRLPNIHFYGGRHTFLPQSWPSLRELLAIMKKHSSLHIEIQGHICCRPDLEDGLDMDAGNEPKLSVNRARAVYDYLVENGIDRNRMRYTGFAGKRPVVMPELTEEDRTANRRVEILILKK